MPKITTKPPRKAYARCGTFTSKGEKAILTIRNDLERFCVDLGRFWEDLSVSGGCHSSFRPKSTRYVPRHTYMSTERLVERGNFENWSETGGRILAAEEGSPD